MLLVESARRERVLERARMILLGDGATWIWERAAYLVSRVAIAANRVTQIVD